MGTGHKRQRSICALERRASSNQRWHSLWLEQLLSLEPRLSTNNRGAVTAVPLRRRWDSLQAGAPHMIALGTAIADVHVGVVITSLATQSTPETPDPLPQHCALSVPSSALSSSLTKKRHLIPPEDDGEVRKVRGLPAAVAKRSRSMTNPSAARAATFLA